MVLVFKHTRMAVLMRVILLMVNQMEKEHFNLKEASILDHLKMVYMMEKAKYNGKMDEISRDFFLKENIMELVNLLGRMGRFMRVNIKII